MPLLLRDHFLWFGGAILMVIVCAITATPWNITLPLAAAVAFLSFLMLFCYRKIGARIRHSEGEQSTQAMVHYRQLEASTWLASLVKARLPLPFMRGMAISPDFGILLVQTIHSHKPQTIVELGCGTSTLLSSYALEHLGKGRIVSIDHDEKFAGICRRQLEQHGLQDKAQIYTCPLVTQMVEGEEYKYYDLQQAPLPERIDLLVVDGPPQWTGKQARYPAFPLLESRLSPTAVILVDDAARSDEKTMVDRWMKRSPDLTQWYVETEKGTATLYRQRQT